MADTRKRGAESQEEVSILKKKRSLKVQSSNPVNKDGFSECFKQITSSMYLSLAPSYLNAPLEGIKSQHLDPLIMKFSSQLHGVILGYSDLNIENQSHTSDAILTKVNAHSPFSFLWVSVTFLVWSPKVGDVLEGLIYMQSPTHIGLLVHDTFNASIKRFNIPEDWTFVPNQEDENHEEDEETEQVGKKRSNVLGQWIDSSEVPVGGKLKITVKKIHTGGKMISLEGTLLRPEEEQGAQPVVPGVSAGKKIKFDDEPVTEKENVVVPGYEDGQGSDVVAEEDSSDEDESDD